MGDTPKLDEPVEVIKGDVTYSFETKYVNPLFLGRKVNNEKPTIESIFLGQQMFDLVITKERYVAGRLPEHEEARLSPREGFGETSFVDGSKMPPDYFNDRDSRAVDRTKELLRGYAATEGIDLEDLEAELDQEGTQAASALLIDNAQEPPVIERK